MSPTRDPDVGEHHAQEPRAASVIAVDSRPLILSGLASSLVGADLELRGTARTTDEALALVRTARPTVAVIGDVVAAGTCDLVRVMAHQSPSTRLLLISDLRHGEMILESLTAGAWGVIKSTVTEAGLIAAITDAASGRAVLPDEASHILAAAVRVRGEARDPELSAREREVLIRIAEGHSAAAIASDLQLALPTVKTHIQNLYGKLGVRDRGSAVATALRRGVIT